MMKRILLLIAIALAVSANVDAKTNGCITDKKDGKPIEGALVKVKDTNVSAYTDSNGCFDFGDNLYAESITITAEGYNTKKMDGRSNMEIRLNKINWWTEKPNWQLFVGLQGLQPSKSLSSTAPGLMVGFVKNVGVYAQAFYRPGKTEGEDFDSHITNGKTAYMTYGYSGGLMFRLNCPIYLYTGCGVTTMKYYTQDVHGNWGVEETYGNNSISAQLGLMFKYKKISINAGAMYRFFDIDDYGYDAVSLSFQDHLALNIGLSYWFK